MENRMRSHWIYAIHEDHGGFIKIGRAGSADRITTRLKQCQVGCPSRLSVIASVPPGDHDGETRIHQQLADYRLRPDGEWFHGADEVYELLGIQRPDVVVGVEAIVARAIARKQAELDWKVKDADRIRTAFSDNLDAMRVALQLLTRAGAGWYDGDLAARLRDADRAARIKDEA